MLERKVDIRGVFLDPIYRAKASKSKWKGKSDEHEEVVMDSNFWRILEKVNHGFEPCLTLLRLGDANVPATGKVCNPLTLSPPPALRPPCTWSYVRTRCAVTPMHAGVLQDA